MTDEELLSKAVVFEILADDPYDENIPIGRITQIRVEMRRSRDGGRLWAISDGRYCLSKKGEWEYESLPSSRTEAFLKRCRWNTAQEAVTFAQDFVKQYPLGFIPEENEDVSDLMITKAQINQRMKDRGIN